MHDAAAIPFHLLRPLWLAALVPVAIVLALVLWRQSPEAQWGGVIARHLLKNLIVQPGRRWSVNPAYLVATGLVLAIVGLSGPTWKRELPPFVEDKAPLMIALALSSRWERPMSRRRGWNAPSKRYGTCLRHARAREPG